MECTERIEELQKELIDAGITDKEITSLLDTLHYNEPCKEIKTIGLLEKALENARQNSCFARIWIDNTAKASELSNRESVLTMLDKFQQDIEKSKERKEILTGFTDLDRYLEGGLYAGLYVVGAISSLGKTTFVLQMADQLAKQGHDVLIFSLEMATSELIAKSISREMFMIDGRKNKNTDAQSTRNVLNGKAHLKYTQNQKELYEQALETYSDYAKHIYIKEGIGNVRVRVDPNQKEQSAICIEGEVKRQRDAGRKPVVIIDYLQLLAPENDRATDKQNADKNILELKRLSRDEDIPIIAISSLNRQNYGVTINMSAFKESGAIEYTSDVLIGLQYKGVDRLPKDQTTDSFMSEQFAKARNVEPQEIELKLLKNRNGDKQTVTYNFYPMFNYFEEVDKFQPRAIKTKKAL